VIPPDPVTNAVDDQIVVAGQSSQVSALAGIDPGTIKPAGGDIGDLLAIGKNGTMWRFDGTGLGGFRGRRFVSSGWSKYNAVISIGDLNNDGCNDLVARSPRGGLWFFAGNCRGGFARPTLISRGWRRFQGLF